MTWLPLVDIYEHHTQFRSTFYLQYIWESNEEILSTSKRVDLHTSRGPESWLLMLEVNQAVDDYLSSHLVVQIKKILRVEAIIALTTPCSLVP